MDILNFTLAELQQILHSSAKARQYLTYLESTHCIFDENSKERAHMEAVLGKGHKSTKIWNECAKSRSTVMLVLKDFIGSPVRVGGRAVVPSPETTSFYRYLDEEQKLLITYAVNSAPNLPQLSHKLQVAPIISNNFGDRVINLYIEHIEPGVKDKSAMFKIRVFTDVAAQLNKKNDLEEFMSKIKKRIPLAKLLEKYCGFYTNVADYWKAINAIIPENIEAIYHPTPSGLILNVGLAWDTMDNDGVHGDDFIDYKLTYTVEPHEFEKLYMNRLVHCNSTLISS